MFSTNWISFFIFVLFFFRNMKNIKYWSWIILLLDRVIKALRIPHFLKSFSTKMYPRLIAIFEFTAEHAFSGTKSQVFSSDMAAKAISLLSIEFFVISSIFFFVLKVKFETYWKQSAINYKFWKCYHSIGSIIKCLHFWVLEFFVAFFFLQIKL